MAENYLEQEQEGHPPEGMYYQPYPQPQIDPFSAAMARAHLAANGFHPMQYTMPNMHPGQPHLGHPIDPERAAQDYYHFAQQQHAQEYAMHQQHQQLNQHLNQQQEQASSRSQKNSNHEQGEGKYQCTMCERSFSRFIN